ncbi:MAG: hypothetical protein ACR2PS_16115, partial [Pseudomonadales bacterium]
DLRLPILLLLLAACVACGGGGGGNSSVDTPATTNEPQGPQNPGPLPPPQTAPKLVNIAGQISFDRVPHFADGLGLDFASTTRQPARFVEVEALLADDEVIATTTTDALGNYSLTVDASTMVRVRANAVLSEPAAEYGAVSVRDNTQGDAIYSLTGNLVSSTETDTARHLHAPSGWNNGAYTEVRAAAPFAVLDTLHMARQRLAAAEPGIAFPELRVFWSIDNRPAIGSLADGEIGTSFYSDGAMYLLGRAGSDADEYDQHVIVHEWWHHLERYFYRSESPGGPHSLSEHLDMRLAYSEGFANAWSAIILADSEYKDSGGVGQASGFTFSVETLQTANPGWFNETSVQSIIHDLLDNDIAGDADDNLRLEVGEVMRSIAIAQQGYVTFSSVFTLLSTLKYVYPELQSDIDALILAQNINGPGIDFYAANETNDAGSIYALPVYTPLPQSGEAAQVCSSNDFGTLNKLANFRYLTFTVPEEGNYRVAVNRLSGMLTTDPDFVIYKLGETISLGRGLDVNQEIKELFLEAGDYTMEVVEFTNVDPSAAGGEACFDVTLMPL